MLRRISSWSSRTSDLLPTTVRISSASPDRRALPSSFPHSHWSRRVWRQRSVKRRNRLHAEVRTELGELSRSRPLTNIAAQSQAFVAALIDTAQQDRARLERAVEDTSDV